VTSKIIFLELELGKMRRNTLKEFVTKNCNPNIGYKCKKGF
jgi:hypothetical protein